MIILPYDTCFGCAGCYNACPKDAITMTADKYGYVHPVIDSTKCIECHICEKVCTADHEQNLYKPIKVIAAVTKDPDELQTVASGGVCTRLGVEIIRRGGVVYGCSEADYRNIRHIRVDNVKDLELLKKSKYVHSEIGDIFRQLKTDLNNGVDVLFIGTPCQVSGLYGYLRKSYDNLYTTDMVCHGVPSQKMLQNQIESYLKHKKNVGDNGFVDFRWKSRYGIRFGIRFGIDGKTLIEESEWRNAYMASFTCGISYRENCYVCPFARQERVADITAADFWGAGQKVESQFVDKKGVSLVLLNTEKGKKLFDSISDNFIIETHTIEEARRCNANLSHPASRLEKRDEFLRIFAEEGIKKAAYMCVPKYRKNTNPVYRWLVSSPIAVNIYNKIKSLKSK